MPERLHKPIAEPCVQTTIQGLSLTLVKHGNRTHFTFTTTGAALGQEEFMATYGSKDPDFVYGLIGQLANVGSPSSIS